MKNIIYNTGVFSIITQFAVGIINYYALTLKVPLKLLFIQKLLWIEYIVQIIEAFFYLWLLSNFDKIKNVTAVRYYDWMITTPTMLFTYIMYLIYLNHYENNLNNINKNNFLVETKRELYPILVIFLLNWIMLAFGYLGETNKLPIELSTSLGFIPFVILFYIIYVKYAYQTMTGRITFYFFSIIWALYGVAALFKYEYKNSFYNIIDLFSKNLTGLLLSLMLINNTTSIASTSKSLI